MSRPRFEAHCWAVCAPGLEEVTAAELVSLGLSEVRAGAGGVSFAPGLAGIIRANLGSRVATRILDVRSGGRARSWARLEKIAGAVPWDSVLPPDVPVHVRVASSQSRLYHERAVAERVARVSGRTAGKGDDAAGVWVRLHEDFATVSVDTSGDFLHKRGYRLQTGRAPLRETLAAGILALCGWQGRRPLLDPMCGSGTFLIEGALLRDGRGPGIARSFTFERWPGVAAERVDAVRAEMQGASEPGETEIVGVDVDEAQVAAARANAQRAGVDVRVEHADIAQVGADGGAPGLMVVNPPYGRRVGRARHAVRAVQTLCRKLPEWDAAMVYALPGPTPPGWVEKARLRNGGIPIRILMRLETGALV